MSDPVSADRLPPHDIEMEQGSLGCVLLAPNEAMPRCIEQFRQFGKLIYYDLRHQLIYSALSEMHEARQPIELITVSEEFKRRNILEQVGGVAYLSHLQDVVPSAANLDYYNARLVEKCLLRRCGSICAGIISAIYDYEGKVENFLADAESEISKLTEFAAGEPEEKHIQKVLTDVLADMEQWHYTRGSQQLRGLPTGPPGVYLDKVLMGIRDTHYVTIAGRPGDGKSSLAMNIVEYLAKDYVWHEPTGETKEVNSVQVAVTRERKGIPVAVFSLEMDNESLGYRLLFGRAGVDEAQFNQGYAHKGDHEKLTAAAAQLVSTNIYLDDTPSQSIGRIAAKARRMAKQYGIKLFVLDYLQLSTSDNPREDERTRLDKISKKIFALKKQLKVPWLVLAQMNRNIETAERDRNPVLSDLAGSGSIEQDSDKVLILKRPSRKELEAPKKTANGEGPSDADIIAQVCGDWEWSRRPSRVDVWVVKNRRGPRGKAEVIFQNNLCRFEDWHLWKVKHGVEGRKEGESKHLGTSQNELPTNEEMGLK